LVNSVVVGGGLVRGGGGGGGGHLVLFGLGGGVDSPGIWSLFRCQFHSSLSSAMLIHSLSFPSLLSVCFVVLLPVVLSIVVVISVISLGKRVCSEHTSEESSFGVWVHTPGW
jgi:hypothetical protein